MVETFELSELPKADEVYILAGWRQWADAGSISSGLPHYLIQRLSARRIGEIHNQGFYLFQIPGTHDLVRPIVKFDSGYPVSLKSQRNEVYFSRVSEKGLVIFLGDEPHLDIDRYTDAFLQISSRLGVKRIVGLGGVYGEVPYNKERVISSVFSMPHLKEVLENLSVNLSDYHGGASIGSVICRKAAENGMEYISFYAFVPTYDFSDIADVGSSIRIENDYKAWLGVMRRINYLLKMNINLKDLEEKSEKLDEFLDKKVEEIDGMDPAVDVREYMKKLGEEFKEQTFDPLDDVWEQALRKLSDKFDDQDPEG